MTHQAKNIRGQILAHAQRLFIERGYHGLALREIAEAVGVSKAALYYHFADKEALFLAVLEGYLDEIETAIETIEAREQTGRGRIKALVRTFLAQPPERRAVVRLAGQELGNVSLPARQAFERAYRERFTGKIEALIRAGMEAGEFKRLDPGIATWSLLGILYPYFHPAQARDLPPQEETIEQIQTIFLDGLAESGK
jgi:AcrR family transcriptional regulator